jgi:3-methyladenine DNA glycosylase AlkC
MLAAGQIVWERLGVEGFERCLGHRSDMVRSWACYALAAEPKGTLAQRLARVRPLADDPHFGVRECAWLALRPMVAKDVEKAVKLLKAWTKDESDRIRRFASEITRPRGVWCVHLTLLRDDPSLGVGVLEPLRSDESKYVQDSVANWLNDASKSRPEWVKEICGRWLTESPSPATQRICKRAMRSIKS